MKESNWQSLRYQVSKEIMNTDILCEVLYTKENSSTVQKHLDHVFEVMRIFESRFSRFKKNNELWDFNHSHEHHPSPELLALLTSSQYFYQLTNGLFDPSVLSSLEKEGYASHHYTTSTKAYTFSDLSITNSPSTITKPRDLFVDFGGIGKGYIVDQVATYLAKHFENFLIDAGGDIYVRGTNKQEAYPYWVIEVEHPEAEQDPAALLLLRDMAVATSGRNRRHWLREQETKHHIIDPRTQKSAFQGFLSVTVIAASTISADILAKILFILGKTEAYTFAEKFNIPAIFIEDSGKVIINPYAQPYVWQAP